MQKRQIDMFLSIYTDGLEAAFFDFDRTLCRHAYIRKNTDDAVAQYFDELTKQDLLHKDDMPLPCMQAFVGEIRRISMVNLICLSQTESSLRDRMNQDFLEKHYSAPMAPGFKYITVPTAENKIAMMEAWCSAKKINRHNALLVEDRMPTLQMAADEGFRCLHISDVAAWHEHIMARKLENAAKRTKELEERLKDAVILKNTPYTGDNIGSHN